MLLTSAAGFVVDKIDQKKYIIGTATTLIGLNFMSLGPFQDRLGLSILTKEILLGVTFGGMGLICPFIIVPIIPDMHASHADALRAARQGRTPQTNEHTTNLISSLVRACGHDSRDSKVQSRVTQAFVLSPAAPNIASADGLRYRHLRLLTLEV